MSENLQLLYNAKIYASGKPFNSWMVFNKKTGEIDSVGQSDPSVSNFPDDRKKNCNGFLILPGLHDSHLHMLMYGKKLCELDLKSCHSIKDFQQAIVDYRGKNPNKKWILGSGWEQDLLGRFPTKDDIDEVCPDAHVLLMRACYHIAVTNQKTLDIAGFNEKTPNINGGVLDKYPPDHPTKPNKLNGILKEISVILEVNKFVPPLTFEEKIFFLNLAIGDLLKYGVTSAHPCEKDTWSEFCHLAENDQLPLRIFYSAFVSSKGEAGTFPESSTASRGSTLIISRVKFFVDGALGPLTAAISVPYECHGGNCQLMANEKCGILVYNHDDLKSKVAEVVKEGYRIEAHVIGDRAAELVLDVLDELNIDPSQRPVFVHCQILREELIERMKRRGVVANIQPQFVNTDARWIGDNLPAALLPFSYPWKTLLRRGIPCAGGSDAPVELPIPLHGIFDAVFRLTGSRDVTKSPVFRPEEKLTIEEAIDIYTKGGAFTAMREKDLGELLPGYLADFIVLDRDICADPRAALDAVVLETWLAGVKKWSLLENK